MKSKYLTLISTNFTENFVFFATMIRKKGKGKDIAIFQIRSWTNSIFVSIQNKKKFISGRKSTSAIWRIFFRMFFSRACSCQSLFTIEFSSSTLDELWQEMTVRHLHYGKTGMEFLPKNKCVPLKSLIWNEAMVNYACQDMIFKFGFKDIPKWKYFLLKLQLS